MLIVVALGGNALLRRGQKMTVDLQRENIVAAARSLAKLVRAGHRIVITHGNGPQIGLIALQAAAGPADGTYPLDVLGAESEGMIGYLIEQELSNQLGPAISVATLLTQTLVSPEDPAFQQPTKPIGPQYEEAMARKLEQERGWKFKLDGSSWRRVVASPKPLRILESPVISMLVNLGVIVICAGGGGIPVIRRADGTLIGIEAVVDKDLASAMLADVIEADFLMLLTDVDGVYLDFESEAPCRLKQIAPGDLPLELFPAGSMRPKLEAAMQFVQGFGRKAAIGRLEQAEEIVSGNAGTLISAQGAGR